MRLNAPLLFALFVLGARAATIPEKFASELEKKIPIDEEVKPQENNSSEQELIDQANTVKDVENNLRNQPVEAIPVTVIVDENDVMLKSSNEVEQDIVRPQADLRNPGPPQRQEHETQNPDPYFEDSRRTVTNFEKSIQDSKIILKQGFQGVTNDIQNWIENREQMSDIQKSIKNLRSSFSAELKKLNDTIKNILAKQSKVVAGGAISEDQANNLRSIKTELNYLEENFNTGLKALTEGVEVVATLKADSEGAASSESGSASEANPAPSNPNPEPAQPVNPSPAPPVATSPPSNPLVQYLQQLQEVFTNGFSNISQLLNNYTNPNQAGADQSSSTPAAAAAPGVQADEQATTQRPTIWGGIQNAFNNFNPFANQAGQNQAPSGQTSAPASGLTFPPWNQAIQNNPLVQGVANFFQGNRGQQTTPAPTQAVVVATSQPATQAAQPEQPQKAPEPQPTPGPIRQIIQNNPIVQGISSTVQRIQGSINNPEKPRDSIVPEESEKGITSIKGGNGSGSGDNNNSGGIIATDTVKEEIQGEEIAEVVDPKKEDAIQPEKVDDKTE